MIAALVCVRQLAPSPVHARFVAQSENSRIASSRHTSAASPQFQSYWFTLPPQPQLVACAAKPSQSVLASDVATGSPPPSLSEPPHPTSTSANRVCLMRRSYRVLEGTRRQNAAC